MILRMNSLAAGLIAFGLAASASAVERSRGTDQAAGPEMRDATERQPATAAEREIDDLMQMRDPAVATGGELVSPDAPLLAPLEAEHPHAAASKEMMRTGAEMHAAGHDIHTAMAAAFVAGAPVEGSVAANEQVIERLQGQQIPAASVNADQVDELNKRVARLLEGVNDAKTKTQIHFRRVELNADRAVNVAADLYYRKTGATGKTIELDLQNISYSFPEEKGARPEVNLAGKLTADLVRIASIDTLDRAAPADDAALKEDVLKYSPAGQLHKDAVTVDAHIWKKVQDIAGHIVSLGVVANLAVDLSKFTETELRSVREAEVHGDAEISRNGLWIFGRAFVNPKESSFAKEGQGLKEWLEALLKGDMEKLRGLLAMVGYLDRAAEDLVKPTANDKLPRLDAAIGLSGAYDAQLLRAEFADLAAGSQVETYTLVSKNAKSEIVLKLDVRGNLVEVPVKTAVDVNIARPIDLEHVISLEDAKAKASVDGFVPVKATLSHASPEKIEYVFTDADGKTVTVDAAAVAAPSHS